jgi:phosphohistidine phosphatase SixA
MKKIITNLNHAIALVPLAMIATAAVPSIGSAQAQTLSGMSLIDALKHGGYVIVMRHASTATEPPQRGRSAPGNTNNEPQLDDMGEATVEAMGYAFRKFAIPVANVYTSPKFAAFETAHFFGFGERHKMDELGTENPSADWLRMQAKQAPPAGQNNLIVTQEENLASAFGKEAENLEPGEALIFRPGGADAKIVARVPIKEWAKLAVLGHA